jgi:hypothetical protein
MAKTLSFHILLKVIILSVIILSVIGSRDFFQGHTDIGLLYLPNHSGKTRLSEQGEGDDEDVSNPASVFRFRL